MFRLFSIFFVPHHLRMIEALPGTPFAQIVRLFKISLNFLLQGNLLAFFESGVSWLIHATADYVPHTRNKIAKTLSDKHEKYWHSSQKEAEDELERNFCFSALCAGLRIDWEILS